MLHCLRSMTVIVLSIGLMWGCGKEGLMKSPAADTYAAPQSERLTKLGGQQASHAEVVFTLKRNGSPLNGAYVEFKYPAEEMPDVFILTLARTDNRGQVSFMFWPKDTMGPYQARAWEDEDQIGSWVNIPISTGYKVMVDLPTGGNATLMGKTPLTPILRKPIDENATSGTSVGSGPGG